VSLHYVVVVVFCEEWFVNTLISEKVKRGPEWHAVNHFKLNRSTCDSWVGLIG